MSNRRCVGPAELISQGRPRKRLSAHFHFLLPDYYHLRIFPQLAHGRIQALPYLLLLPSSVLIATLLLLPTLNATMMSFHNWDLFGNDREHYFIWFRNYQNAFANPLIGQSLLTTATFTGVSVALEFVIGLGAALLVNRPFFGRSLARIVLLVPWAIPFVPWSMSLMLFFQRDIGILNRWLLDLHVVTSPVDWLGGFGTALPAVIATRVWKSFSFVSVMLLAGLQTIPDEYYEAAHIDGAKSWRQFLSITLPHLQPVILVTTLLLVVWHLKDFALVYLMTGGGPGTETMLFVLFIWKSAFETFRFGEAAAAAMILLAIGLIFATIYIRLLTFEESGGA